MNEPSTILEVLQVAVPSDTPVTFATEIKILELVGIVSNPQLVAAMQLASALVPASTPTTVMGLVQLLASLTKMGTKATAAHHKAMADLVAALSAVPDEPLTFGSLLSICQSLIKAAGKSRSHRKT